MSDLIPRYFCSLRVSADRAAFAVLCQGRMEERTREHVQAAQDNSHLHAKLRGMQVRLAEAEARAGRFKALAKREEHRAQLAQGPAAAASASDNRQADMGAPAPSVDSSVRQQLREREEDLAASASELSNLRQQLMQVLGSNNALQVRALARVHQGDWCRVELCSDALMEMPGSTSSTGP